MIYLNYTLFLKSFLMVYIYPDLENFSVKEVYHH